jgi:Na+/proline symporter
MLLTAVIAYLAVTIAIGLVAASRVKGSADFLVAGRSLPTYMTLTTVFATWYGAEAVLSISVTAARDGLSGIPADPFGATTCLLLVALLFAKHFYRMNLLTIGDFYRKRYGKSVEVITSLAIAASYVGWTSAQLTALGLMANVLTHGAVSINQGILIGAGVVLAYTVWGGMISVAFTDLFQSAVVVTGLLGIAWFVGDLAGGAGVVFAAAHDAGRLSFFPQGPQADWWSFGAAFFTMALGSIPQQDVFQRVTSAKDEASAVRGTIGGALLYFTMAFVPMFIVYATLVVDPTVAASFESEDARAVQRILPDLILAKTPLWAQAIFFGALVSALLSTASGALLAPTSLITENVLRPFMGPVSDRRFLRILRVVLVCCMAAAALFAFNSRSTMYEIVENAYKVTLVCAFVPLAAGIWWSRATVQGALASATGGIVVWLACEGGLAEQLGVPAQLVGLAASLLLMVVGSLAPQLYTERRPHAAHELTDRAPLAR